MIGPLIEGLAMRVGIASLFAVTALIGGCAHKPVSLDACDLPRTPLRTEVVRGAVAGADGESAPAYEALIRGALDGRPARSGYRPARCCCSCQAAARTVPSAQA